MSLPRTVYVLMLMLLLPAALFAQSKAKADEAGGVKAAVEKAEDAFCEAYNRGDAETVGGMYTSDAMVLPPQGEMVQGNKAIAGFWKDAMASGIKSVALTTIDVGSSGDLAYETGKATLTVQAEGGEPTMSEVKYVVVWKRENGSWKLHRDIWNAMPAKE